MSRFHHAEVSCKATPQYISCCDRHKMAMMCMRRAVLPLSDLTASMPCLTTQQHLEAISWNDHM